jgi:hypothetical protein
VGADIVDGEDVGVVEGAGGAGLLLEPAEVVAVGDLRGEDLDGHLAVETGIVGPVDLTHAARAEEPDDLVRTELSA